MKIRITGAGPAGLYFAALMKQHDPAHEITLFERSPRDATWGFGVVFSDRALEFLRADDEALYRYLTPHLETWPDLTIVHNDTRIPIAGNGFAAIGRLELLTLLYAHVERLGVKIEFETEVTSLADLGDADLIVGANGAFSWIRAENEAKFGTTTQWRSNKFIWYGTSKAFDTLTLTFRQTDAGVFCAHHYRYQPDMSTFLVEVEEGTWQRAGFKDMSPEDTIRYCERVFAKDLGGHPIISNNSYWRNFPVIWNERWSFGNVVLLGDALRTAHFSIGSGTRLAMEDAVALFKAFKECGADIPAALARFQEKRLPPMKKIWDAANVSIAWYERMDELVATLNPVEFAYSYMTRSGRVDHAEVRRRDPNLARAYEALHPIRHPRAGGDPEQCTRYVIPAQAGIQSNAPDTSSPRRRGSRAMRKHWIPTCAGMTTYHWRSKPCCKDSRAGRKPRRGAIARPGCGRGSPFRRWWPALPAANPARPQWSTASAGSAMRN